MLDWSASNRIPPEYLADLAIERLGIQSMLYDVKLTAFERVLCCMQDPIRLFVKNEGHKLDKRVTGRVRLIHSVSVLDNLLLKLVVKDQQMREISVWEKIPSSPGIGFTQEQVDLFMSHMPSGPFGHSDMSGWDFSVQFWEIMVVFQLNALLEFGGKVVVNPFPAALWLQYQFTSLSVFLIADGTLVEQIQPGWQKSGADDTSAKNSKTRTLVHRLCGGVWNRAAGDDLVGDPVQDYSTKAAFLGHILRDAKVTQNTFRFCSADWDVSKRTLVHEIAKPLFNFVTRPRTQCELTQFLLFLRHHPLERQIRLLLAEEWLGLGNASEEEAVETDPEGASALF